MPRRSVLISVAFVAYCAAVWFVSTKETHAQVSPFSFEQVSISTVAVTVSSATYTGMQACRMTVESNAIRWRPDGTAPTSSVGVPVAAAGTIDFPIVSILAQSKFIRQSADATGWVVCWRAP